MLVLSSTFVGSSGRSLKLAGPLLALAGALSVAGCDRHNDAPVQPAPSAAATSGAPEAAGTVDRSHKGEPLPDVTVSDAGGGRLALRSLKGRPALINLWATWCAPCVAELPTLDTLAAQAGPIRVLTISQDQSPARVPAFLKDKGGVHLHPWLDPKADLSFHYKVETLPTTVLYDAGGKEVWRYTGGHNWAGADAAKLLANEVR